MTNNVIQKIEALHCCLQKAKGIVADNRVKPVLGMAEHYVVESTSGEGHYLVNDTCTCPDAVNRSELTNGLCKHKLAVLWYQEAKGIVTEASEKKAA